ncbi:undecaprenyldiphospho-muramoylpentapeptide beta-N-acetylglucosaminyltransferase [Hyphomicrobium sp.]|jgi:UDP-N-acetylglucosamine--N-acetylmuramyl-(pentapeptide) pyrophosphoryl-undecaprenol N-acetylglucosamine transferase|uniref:undecaprenyldiphospho-muramoylpentapeptide beta-N-acetylglucosaminyltransferase n=1 Tax=Hyphomicrobium sp. TaxID=82 RepID=UPI002D1AAA27|nr:undecaprenyldiphospho-muramoylpentapeptide beta-N-acetylglucosaminyltransferase [Hyphomicrobium sp.]HVZ03174.1 undecaprenyldiphospho-muramoylpentapeptide beta-N-acetylglucosaminyltransferase [Hyphomicrobium sp.]
MSGMQSIMLAAGGTGGHLFPAFALAEELKRRGVAVDLMTDMRGDRYGGGFPARTVYQVPSATLASRAAGDVAKTMLTLARGTGVAFRMLGQAKPHAVIGFGGYPTYPPLVAARLRAIPTAIHEQNAVLGRANKLLAKGVTAIATSFDRTKFLDGRLAEKSVLTGNPVRKAVLEAAALGFLPPLSDSPIRILIFGGSQGARFFSDVVPLALFALSDMLRARLRVVQQAREEDIERVRDAYSEAGIKAEIASFFTDLPARMADAHLVIGRAGASTVAELTVIGRPSILVPLPHALDNDQLNNARRLEEAGGAWCFEQRTLSPERLADELERLLKAPDSLAAAAKAAKNTGRPDAVRNLADFALALAEGRRPGGNRTQ